MEKSPNPNRRLMILATTTGYQTQSFVEAARKLNLSVVFGTDRCHVLEDPWRDGALPLRFEDPEGSAREIVEYVRVNRLDAIVALGDQPTPTAAHACRALGLLHHPPEATDICRNKYQSRERLRAAGLNVPAFERFPLESNPQELLQSGMPEWGYPCVLKPLALSASRGVIRVDNPEEFVPAFARIRALLASADVRVMREETSHFIQVEKYIEGEEIAVEGLVNRGRLKVLAIFDKPDPLTGPFFEETIYLTPSRLPQAVQEHVTAALEQCVRALGLRHGPLHAEMRINTQGVWVLEVAARSIGGLCSRALRFCAPGAGEQISLEELIIHLALGEEIQAIQREKAASGVMMIPIPAPGIYQEVEGVSNALTTPGIDEIQITAKQGQKLIPLPEGASYLGFIFARGESPEIVENALRQAHATLRFQVSPALPVI